MINIFKIIGTLGLVFIILGLLIKSKNRKIRDILYIFGGLFLAIYSIHLKDIIFIVLQFIFVIVAVYDLIKLKLKN